MRPRLTPRALFRCGFPLCGWLSLALFVIAVSGLPVPIPFAKDLSRAFPCMYSQCGCRDADQCWRSCCCHPATARVAWAKAHAIQPPASLVAAAQAEGTNAGPASTSCCQTTSKKACHENTEGCATSSCPDDTAHSGGVSFTAALRCHGVGEVVAGVPICLPPPRLAWQPIFEPLAALGLRSTPALSLVSSPPMRPPRARDC